MIEVLEDGFRPNIQIEVYQPKDVKKPLEVHFKHCVMAEVTITEKKREVE